MGNHKGITVVSKKAEGFKTELTEYLKDKTVALLSHASIYKMNKEIK